MKLLRSSLRTAANNWSALPLRFAVALPMLGHGGQKLFGWWHGYGLQGTAGFFDSVGLQPGLFWAALASGFEFFGGVALLLGIATRGFAATSAAIMAVAIVTVHRQAYFISNNGAEYALALLLASSALVLSGGGALSLDAALSRKNTA